jgi:CheY-like chemotaxis protein
VPRQSERYALDLDIMLYASQWWRAAVVQDVSRTGMFVAAESLPVGTKVVVALDHDGTRVENPALVTHCLGADEAHELCRTPGIGLAFDEPVDVRFTLAIEQLLRRARGAQPHEYHIVVADPELRVLERLSNALDSAGFSVATASNGLELFGACIRRTPDVVLVDRHTPMVGGIHLLERFAGDDQLASIPVVVMTSEAGEMESLFARGAADAIMKPFTLVEAIARVRRLASTPQRRAEHVLLSGSIGELGLAPVLTMMELEKKTGRLVVSNGNAAWIDVVDGRIVDAGWSLDQSAPRIVVLALLDWHEGTFKLVTSPPTRRDSDLAMPITHLLLEQARLADEAARLH